METQDLFEFLKNAVECEYISDLQFSEYNHIARIVLKIANIENYPLYALSDAAQYIFRTVIEFTSHEEAAEFFRNAKQI